MENITVPVKSIQRGSTGAKYIGPPKRCNSRNLYAPQNSTTPAAHFQYHLHFNVNMPRHRIKRNTD